MNLLLLAVGIFAGIAVAMATFYSIAQVFVGEGRARWAHGLTLGLTLAVMAALQWGSIPAARVLALPLLLAAIWAFSAETRWFRLFPALQQIFAVVLILGLVAL